MEPTNRISFRMILNDKGEIQDKVLGQYFRMDDGSEDWRPIPVENEPIQYEPEAIPPQQAGVGYS